MTLVRLGGLSSMSIRNEIKSYIVKKGLNVSLVNDMLNERNNTNLTPQNLNKKINNNSIKYSEVKEIAEVLGYDIIWIERK